MFHRGVVQPGEQVEIGFANITRPDGIPPCPESLLPPPGSMHLEVYLEEELGLGRISSVRAVNVLTPDIELPRLVMKVSHYERLVNSRKRHGSMKS